LVHTGANVTAVRRHGDEIAVTAELTGTRRELRAEEVLVTTGRRPDTARLGLDLIGVEVGGKGEIVWTISSRRRTRGCGQRVT
jgi:mercuric reductase